MAQAAGSALLHGNVGPSVMPTYLDRLISWIRRRRTPETDDIVARTRRGWAGADPYYADAENVQWVATFWAADSPFRALFERLDHDRIIEFACGHGRHSWQIREWPNHKTLVDFVEANIAFCRKRFEGYGNITFLVNNGRDLAEIESGSATSLFCYDAMVHFDHTIVRPYLAEAARVLVPGGMALLHHSNYEEHPDRDFTLNPHFRAFMSLGLFGEYAKSAGLVIVEQRVIDWDPFKNLDAISLLRKS